MLHNASLSDLPSIVLLLNKQEKTEIKTQLICELIRNLIIPSWPRHCAPGRRRWAGWPRRPRGRERRTAWCRSRFPGASRGWCRSSRAGCRFASCGRWWSRRAAWSAGWRWARARSLAAGRTAGACDRIWKKGEVWKRGKVGSVKLPYNFKWSLTYWRMAIWSSCQLLLSLALVN